MDLLVGASILLSVVILITGVLWLKEVNLASSMVDYAVLFPNVGTLQVGDPVMINGVSKGSVKKITLRKGQVLTILEIEKDVAITDSCRIMIQNIGLMGERGVGVQFSESGRRMEPIAGPDTLFIIGSFDTGIAEAMGMLGAVLDEVRLLAINLSAIVDQTVGDTAFLSLFKTLSCRLDTISLVVQQMALGNRSSIEQSIKNVQELSENAKKLIERNIPQADTIFENGKLLTSRAIALAGTVDSLVASIQTVVNKLHDRETTAGMLLSDKQLYDDLATTVADLDTLVKSIQDDALKLRIRIGFGSKKK